MTTLTLIRGLPGSGKSTLAKTLGCLHVEADMYFMKSGVYVYNGAWIKDAHMWCQSVARFATSNLCDVVVSNTFTTLREMQPYLGIHYDNLKVIRCVGNYGSIHDVPEEVIKKMAARFQDYEGEEIHE